MYVSSVGKAMNRFITHNQENKTDLVRTSPSAERSLLRAKGKKVPSIEGKRPRVEESLHSTFSPYHERKEKEPTRKRLLSGAVLS